MKDPLFARYLTYFLCFQIIFVQILAKQTVFIEKYYSHLCYPVISNIYRKLAGWIPFSLGDLIYILFVLLIFRFLYIVIRDQFDDVRKYLFSIGATLSILHFLFYANWGLNYYRTPLNEKLEMTNKSYTLEHLEQYTEKLIFELNEIHLKITHNRKQKIAVPHKRKEMHNLAVKAYQKLQKQLPLFIYKNPSVKHSLLSTPLTYMGFSGYFNPFTGEAQVNSKIPRSSYAFTTCHEMAHQIGYAAENEANFIAYLATTHSDNLHFQYAGKLTALKYVFSELSARSPLFYEAQLQHIHSGIFDDLNDSRRFWQSHKNPLEPWFKKIYGSFLKANKQKGGMQSYGYMVRLLLNYSEKDFIE